MTQLDKNVIITVDFIPGDGIFQDRQAATDHLQLLPPVAGRGRPDHRGLLRAPVHRDVDHGEVAILQPPVRRLAGHRLPGQ